MIIRHVNNNLIIILSPYPALPRVLKKETATMNYISQQNKKAIQRDVVIFVLRTKIKLPCQYGLT